MHKVFMKILIIETVKKDMTFGTSTMFSRLSIKNMILLK